MEAFRIGKYLSSIEKCKTAIDVYEKYYKFLGNSGKILTHLQLYRQDLISTDALLRVNINLSDPRVSAAVKRLNNIIISLNELNDNYSKVVNTITERSFGKNKSHFNRRNQRHISNSFQIYLDPELEIDRFSFKVSNLENGLNGTLGLYYSLDKNVPFGSKSQPIVNNISYGNSTAAVPHDLFGLDHNKIFFGFHYDGFKDSGFDINNPIKIETSVNYKMPEEIYLDDLGNEEINVVKLTQAENKSATAGASLQDIADKGRQLFLTALNNNVQRDENVADANTGRQSSATSSSSQRSGNVAKTISSTPLSLSTSLAHAAQNIKNTGNRITAPLLYGLNSNRIKNGLSQLANVGRAGVPNVLRELARTGCSPDGTSRVRPWFSS